ncbi:MAG: RNA polymerase sigma factor [Pirellula sp.]
MKPERPLEPAIVSECHAELRAMLERYAWAVVRDRSLASDAVQNAFVALARFGGDVAPNARKAWLFRVVHREALRIRKTENKHQSSTQTADLIAEPHPAYEVSPLANIARDEDAKRLQSLVDSLPPDQQRVLQLRVFEDKTFAEIAEQLQIPIGTALSRMRLAMQRLRAEGPKDDYGK